MCVDARSDRHTRSTSPQAVVLEQMKVYVEAGYPIVALIDAMFAELNLVDTRAS